MNKNDEIELHRLAEMFRKIDEELDSSSPYREVLLKGVLALHKIFIDGHRLEIEQQYNT